MDIRGNFLGVCIWCDNYMCGSHSKSRERSIVYSLRILCRTCWYYILVTVSGWLSIRQYTSQPARITVGVACTLLLPLAVGCWGATKGGTGVSLRRYQGVLGYHCDCLRFRGEFLWLRGLYVVMASSLWVVGWLGLCGAIASSLWVVGWLGLYVVMASSLWVVGWLGLCVAMASSLWVVGWLGLYVVMASGLCIVGWLRLYMLPWHLVCGLWGD